MIMLQKSYYYKFIILRVLIKSMILQTFSIVKVAYLCYFRENEIKK